MKLLKPKLNPQPTLASFDSLLNSLLKLSLLESSELKCFYSHNVERKVTHLYWSGQESGLKMFRLNVNKWHKIWSVRNWYSRNFMRLGTYRRIFHYRLPKLHWQKLLLYFQFLLFLLRLLIPSTKQIIELKIILLHGSIWTKLITYSLIDNSSSMTSFDQTSYNKFFQIQRTFSLAFIFLDKLFLDIKRFY